MDRQYLPYENLGGPTLDAFSDLLGYLFLGGLGLTLLIVMSWLVMLLLKKLGWYTPTGPLERRLGQLLVLVVLGVIMVGGVAVIFFWFALDPSPEWPPRP